VSLAYIYLYDTGYLGAKLRGRFGKSVRLANSFGPERVTYATGILIAAEQQISGNCVGTPSRKGRSLSSEEQHSGTTILGVIAMTSASN